MNAGLLGVVAVFLFFNGSYGEVTCLSNSDYPLVSSLVISLGGGTAIGGLAFGSVAGDFFFSELADPSMVTVLDGDSNYF